MGRLVDTDDLEKGLAALMQRNGIKSWYSTAFDACDFESLIDDAPTVDAVEVVRCKDCMYLDIPKCCPSQLNGFEVTNDWYCPMGVKEETKNE